MKRYALGLLVLAFVSMVFALPQNNMAYGMNLIRKISQMNINTINSRLDNPSLIYQDDYSDGAWVENSKIELTYAQNHLTEALTYMQMQPGTYVKYMRVAYTYQNNLTTHIGLEMNVNLLVDPMGDPVWMEMAGFDFVYNTNNHVIQMSMYSVDFETGDVADGSRAYLIYNNNQVQFMYTSDYNDETDSWEYEKKEIFFEGGKLNHMINQTSADSSSWVNADYESYTYDPSDNSNYDTFQNMLDNSFIMPVHYVYPFPGAKITQKNNQTWNGTTWVDAEKTIYTFDANWNIIEELNQEIMNTEWNNIDKTAITYVDANRIDTIIESSWMDNEESYGQRMRLQYGTGSTDNEAIFNKMHISSYPNPFKSDAIVSVKSENSEKANIQLFDIKGRKIASGEIMLNKNTEISLNSIMPQSRNLASGIYFIKINTKDVSLSKKIIKIK